MPTTQPQPTPTAAPSVPLTLACRSPSCARVSPAWGRPRRVAIASTAPPDKVPETSETIWPMAAEVIVASPS
eukprot:scaffold124968_cov36-Phaeocystis_antarctica.AAC.1